VRSPITTADDFDGIYARSQTISCWGIDRWNEPLGFYDKIPRPRQWPQFEQVSAGGNVICAVRLRGELHSWGFDRDPEAEHRPDGLYSNM